MVSHLVPESHCMARTHPETFVIPLFQNFGLTRQCMVIQSAGGIHATFLDPRQSMDSKCRQNRNQSCYRKSSVQMGTRHCLCTTPEPNDAFSLIGMSHSEFSCQFSLKGYCSIGGFRAPLLHPTVPPEAAHLVTKLVTFGRRPPLGVFFARV